MVGPRHILLGSEPKPRAAVLQGSVPTQRKPEEDACVVGAVIDLGFCLDLTSLDAAELIGNAYDDLQAIYEMSDADMPTNEGGPDSVFRNLDCAVINHIHQSRSDAGEEPFNSVKGFFQEGGPIYENSGFFRRTHIQIAVRHTEQIKGVFRVSA